MGQNNCSVHVIVDLYVWWSSWMYTHANYFKSKHDYKYLLPFFIHPPSNCGTKNVSCVSLCGDKYFEILWNVHKLVWVNLITLINIRWYVQLGCPILLHWNSTLFKNILTTITKYKNLFYVMHYGCYSNE